MILFLKKKILTRKNSACEVDKLRQREIQTC